MDGEGGGRTAREWLVLLLIGVALVIVGNATLQLLIAVGVIVALVAAGGLTMRLLKGR